MRDPISFQALRFRWDAQVVENRHQLVMAYSILVGCFPTHLKNMIVKLGENLPQLSG